MRHWFIIIIGILAAPGLFAQDASEVPRLLQQYRNAGSDSARASALALISFHMARANPDSARLTGVQALAIGKRIKNTVVLSDALNSLGWLEANQGDVDSAEVHLQQALSLAEGAKDRGKTAAVLVNLGWLVQHQGNDDKLAMKYFLRALGDAESVQDSTKVAAINYSIGITYRKAGEWDQAMDYLNKSLRTEEELGRQDKMANCHQSIANTYRDQGNKELAMHHYEQAAALYTAARDLIGTGMVEENIGDMVLADSPVQALEHYHNALKQYRTIGSLMDQAYILRAIWEVNIRLGRLGHASQALDSGRAMAVAAKATDLVMDYERTYAELAIARNDAKGVAAHLNRYMALKDSLHTEQADRDLMRLRTEFGAERKEKDNALLREQNLAQQTRLYNRGLQLYGSLAIAVLALLAAVLSWRNLRQKRKHSAVLEKLNAELGRQHAEITEINGLLEMKLLRSQMNPHFIYNCLSSAAQMTQEGQQAEALAYLQGFARLLRMVLEFSVRDQVPIEEEVEFLELYLKLEAYRLPDLSYRVQLDEGLIDEGYEIPGMLVQPFVENALWHGLANKEGERNLLVRFSRNNGRLTCRITDNGIGRGKAAPVSRPGKHRSLGMELTGQRLRLLAKRLDGTGTMAIEDLKDADGAVAGTQVSLEL